jgi:hypothetical protein
LCADRFFKAKCATDCNSLRIKGKYFAQLQKRIEQKG